MPEVRLAHACYFDRWCINIAAYIAMEIMI